MNTAQQIKDLQQAAQTFGQRLGFLISALNVADEVKEALLVLLPQMTEQQLWDFSEILEQAYINDKTIEFDQQLIADLKSIVESYDSQSVGLLNETADQLTALLVKIKSSFK